MRKKTAGGAPGDRQAAHAAALLEAVFGSSPVSGQDPRVRAAGLAGDGVPANPAGYPVKVRDASYRITDADVRDLRGRT